MLFCIANLTDVGRKNISLLYGFLNPRNQTEVKYSHYKCWQKKFSYRKNIETCKKSKSKENLN